MSKIRIYELARELGVDNKVVIERAAELGITGRTSHSSSLESWEADQIRKVLARAGSSADGQGAKTDAVKSEKVTSIVDKTTGSTQRVLEIRSGNVIRRRKASDAPGSGAPVQQPAPQGEGSAAIASPEVAPAAVEVAEALTPPVNEAPPAPELTPPPSLEAEQTVAAAPATEVVAEEAPVEAVTEPVSEAPAAAKAAPAPTVGGPKILGKIVLPVRRVAAPKPPVGTTGKPVARPLSFGDDEGPKKKGRRVEFQRGDLVDYSGREGGRNKKRKNKDGSDESRTEPQVVARVKRDVKMDEVITVGELARQLSIKAGQVIAKLLDLGVMATINNPIDYDTAAIIVEEFGGTLTKTGFDETEILQTNVVTDSANLVIRPPVVTVMGHVDHGKTSLLDAIRNASVAAKEHGGITQHIGAYQVMLPDGRPITFLDTPGHAAFTQMRARGAQVTDIVILVVAADDGPMPQTIEALNHAKAANVPIIVAVNKIDRPDANIEKVKQKLVEHGLQPEDWGGDTMYFPVSATKKLGITELLEGVLLVAEVKELKADPTARARGTIVDSRQDRGRGTVATVLVQSGTLRVGDVFVCGAESGRVRTLLDERGAPRKEAPPSTPVEISGFSGMPSAGDDFFVVESEAEARQVALNRSDKRKAKEQALASGPISLEEFAKRAGSNKLETLNVIVKADVHGSVEAVREALEKLSTEKVKVIVLHAAVGGVTESDVQLAAASSAIVVGFGVRAEARAAQEAESKGIDMRFYKIIYELLDDVKKAMAGLLEPIKKEIRIGRAEVRQTFMVSKVGLIAGSFVQDGVVRRSAKVRLLRDSRVVFEGNVSSLKRLKDDAREVTAGYECGIGIENFNDVKVGDVMEFFEIKEEAASID